MKGLQGGELKKDWNMGYGKQVPEFQTGHKLQPLVSGLTKALLFNSAWSNSKFYLEATHTKDFLENSRPV